MNERLKANLDAAGIQPDANGQYEFADLIYYSEDLSIGKKIFWLERVQKEFGGQAERLVELRKLTNPAPLVLSAEAERELETLENEWIR